MNIYNILRIIDILKKNIIFCYKLKILKKVYAAHETFRTIQKRKYQVWLERITNFFDSWYIRKLMYTVCNDTD